MYRSFERNIFSENVSKISISELLTYCLKYFRRSTAVVELPRFKAVRRRARLMFEQFLGRRVPSPSFRTFGYQKRYDNHRNDETQHEKNEYFDDRFVFHNFVIVTYAAFSKLRYLIIYAYYWSFFRRTTPVFTRIWFIASRTFTFIPPSAIYCWLTSVFVLYKSYHYTITTDKKKEAPHDGRLIRPCR